MDMETKMSVELEVRPRPELPRIEYASVEEVAMALDTTPALIQRWIRGGKLRATKFGNRHRIPLSEVERVVREFEGAS